MGQDPSLEHQVYFRVVFWHYFISSLLSAERVDRRSPTCRIWLCYSVLLGSIANKVWHSFQLVLIVFQHSIFESLLSYCMLLCTIWHVLFCRRHRHCYSYKSSRSLIMIHVRCLKYMNHWVKTIRRSLTFQTRRSRTKYSISTC